MKEYKKILIVEDEWVNAQYIKAILEELNHTVIDIVSNAKDAISCVQNNPIDLVFMDINIQGSIDGIQCAIKLNQMKPLPIIYLTAYNDMETINEASLTNLYGFIPKPFDQKNVEIVLSVALARIKQEQPSTIQSKIEVKLNNGYTFNREVMILKCNGTTVKLTKTETKLMTVLCKKVNNIVPLKEIHLYLYNSLEKSDSTLRDVVSRLRKKVPDLIITNVHGVGYILEKRE